MKKIIGGKKYNTETAKLVKEYYDYNTPSNDLRFFTEELYLKRTGEFFLHGSGNAGSKYAKPCGQHTYSGGEGIIPLTINEAKKWAEKNMEVDEYEKVFGEVSE